MKPTKKVLTESKFRTMASGSSLNIDSRARALIVGRRGGSDTALGFVGKFAEVCGGVNLLDYSAWLDLSFPHVIGIFGTRGTGKSFSLGVLVECLAGLPKIATVSTPPAATVIFDVQNQFWTLPRLPDKTLPEDAPHLAEIARWGLSAAPVPNVVCWMPHGGDSHIPEVRPFRISPGQLEPSDWLSLLGQERYSPMGQALITLLRLSEDHNPVALAACCRQNAGLADFQSSTLDGLRWRLEATAEMGLIGTPGVDIAELLQVGRTSVILLRTLADNMRALSAGVLTRLLAQKITAHHQRRKIARRGGVNPPQETMPERLWVVIDEAHIIAPRDGATPANAALIDYVKRGRDSGLSLIFATQQPSAVDSKLMSQVDITLTHGLSFEADIQAAQNRMPAKASHAYRIGADILPALGDVIRSLDNGEAIIADGKSSRVFIGKIRPRLSAHGGNAPESG